MELPFAESWKIKMVEPIRKSTRQEREKWIKEAHYNLLPYRFGYGCDERPPMGGDDDGR